MFNSSETSLGLGKPIHIGESFSSQHVIVISDHMLGLVRQALVISDTCQLVILHLLGDSGFSKEGFLTICHMLLLDWLKTIVDSICVRNTKPYSLPVSNL